jgi:hypothetical protein
MKSYITLLAFCLISIHSEAIDWYNPGDTLWVWAKTGLSLRESPDVKSKVLIKVKNAEKVIMLDYPDQQYPFELEEIKSSIQITPGEGKKEFPGYALTGYWAKVRYGEITGFVFDAFLSRLPTITGDPHVANRKEDFHVEYFKKHHKLLRKIGQPDYDKEDNKSIRYVFDNGNMVAIDGVSAGWWKNILFTEGLSLTEGYLIYVHTLRTDFHILTRKGTDFLEFDVGDGTVTIKKAGMFLVITEDHHC